MSHRLKKKDSPASLAFPSSSLDYLKAFLHSDCFPPGDGLYVKLVADVVECGTNGKDQLAAFKKLCAHTKGWKYNGIGECIYPHYVAMVSKMFAVCSARHPMRRTIASHVQNFEESEKLLFKAAMLEEITKLCDGSITLLSNRAKSDLIAALMENFATGDDLVAENFTLLAQLVNRFLDICAADARIESNAGSQTFKMADCLAVLKTSLAVVHRFLKTLPVPTNASFDCLECSSLVTGSIQFNGAVVVETLCSLFLKSFDIATDESFLLDCRAAAAMLIPAVLHFLRQPEREHIVNILFGSLHEVGVVTTVADDDLVQVSASPLLHVVRSACLRMFEQRGSCMTMRVIMLHALLVKASPDLLHAAVLPGQSLFNTCFLSNLVEFSKTTTERGALLLAIKAMCLWVGELHAVLKEGREASPSTWAASISAIDVPELMKRVVLPHFLSYVDHPLDKVRHKVKDGIECCFLILGGQHVDGVSAIFTEYLTCDLKSRGKLSMVKVLSGFMTASAILRMRPKLPEDLLLLLGDVDLVSHSCDLYGALARQSLNEVQVCREAPGGPLHGKLSNEAEVLKSWTETWVWPVYSGISSSSDRLRANITTFILPMLLSACPSLLKQILADINDTNVNHHYSTLRITVSLLRIVRSSRDVKANVGVRPSDESATLWKGLLELHLLRQCLRDCSEQVRLDAFALICESLKICEEVDAHDRMLVEDFLIENMNSQNPAFRQKVVTSVKYLLLRMFAHGFQLEKLAASDRVVSDRPDAIERLGQYGELIASIVRSCFKIIYDTASYAQITSALSMLSLISVILEENRDSAVLRYVSFSEEEKSKFSKQMLNCFEDTYDPNRVLVYEMFARRPVWLGELKLPSLFDEVVDRMFHPQPDVSSVAAYQASYLVLSLDVDELRSLRRQFYGRHACCRQVPSSEAKQDQLPISGGCCSAISEERLAFWSPALVMFDVLLCITQKHLVVMKQGLVKAAKGAPLYPALYGIRLLLQFHKQGLSGLDPETYAQVFLPLVSELLGLCLEIVQIVSPFVSSDAPEGELCDANISDLLDKLSLPDIEMLPSIELQCQLARLLLVCSWRSLKEVSQLIGLIVTEYAGSSEHSLPDSTLKVSWDMFTDILLRSKHAGAYELASLAFTKLCSVLWTSGSSELSDIPRLAVDSIIADLTSDSCFKLPVTRRGAGIPFYLQAVCATEPAIHRQRSFNKLMSTLVGVCLHEDSALNQRVVCLNALRMFFKDAKLGADVFPFVSDGVMIAVRGFASHVWAVRNTSTLLFNALMQRIFGVKKSKMTGREFFSRFPSLYGFMMEQATLMTATSVSRERLHPSVFPVLLLLSHLYPSAIDGTDSLLRLDSFVPHVLRCASSPVFKTRKMAARALLPLIASSNMKSTLALLFQQLSNRSASPDNNLVHGSLLQIYLLLRKNRTSPVVNSHDVDTMFLSDSVSRARWLASASNGCCMTKALYIDLVSFCVSSTSERGMFTEVMEECLNACVGVLLAVDVAVTVGWSLLQRSSISFVVALSAGTEEMRDILTTTLLHSGKDVDVLLEACFESASVDVLVPAMAAIQAGKLLVSDRVVDLILKFALERTISDSLLAEVLNTLCFLAQHSRRLDAEKCRQIWTKHRDVVAANSHDAIKSSLVRFAGCCLQLNLRAAEAPNASDCQGGISPFEVESMWLFICKCVEPEQSEETRLAVAEGLLAHVPWQPNQTTCVRFDVATVVTAVPYFYLHCCINLLMDDDSSVRDAASKAIFRAIRKFQSGKGGALPLSDWVLSDDSYCPQVAVVWKLLFDVLVKDRLYHDLDSCVQFLLCQINQQHLLQWLSTRRFDTSSFLNLPLSECQSNASYPVVFQEGKVNPYFDETKLALSMCSLLSSCVAEHLGKLQDKTLRHCLLAIRGLSADERFSIDARRTLGYLRQFAECIPSSWL